MKRRSLPVRKSSLWGAIWPIVAALLYGVSPIDLIPDIIPLLGLADDAAVGTLLGFVALRAFLRWRESRATRRAWR